MDNISETFKHIDNIYTKKTFLDRYGGAVLITVLTVLIFFVIFSWFYIRNKLEPIKKNWANERCKPTVMPFAGIIMNPKDESKMQYTTNNFMNCTTDILSNIVKHFLKPVYYITNLLASVIIELAKALEYIRAYIYELREKFKSIMSYIIARINNVVIPLQRLIIKFKDTLYKITGVMATSLFSLMGLQLALKSFVGAFLEALIIFLTYLVALIIILWIAPWTWALAGVAQVVSIVVAIFTAIVIGWTSHIYNLQNRKVPGGESADSCFDKNTLINIENNKQIKIKDIIPGSILENGDRVTAIFKSARDTLDVYNLDGIIVTGCHKVFHSKLGWIKVENHPSSKKLENYTDQFVYCLNTESKRIYINEHKFLDWDDIEPIDIIKLKNLKYLSNNSSVSDIHKYLESGLHGDTMIELENGLSVKLKDLQVNDQLNFNERVIGLVEIDTKNISVQKYTFGNFNIIGGPNLRFKDPDLGISNTLNIIGKQIKKPDKLYHILTDTGTFTVNSIKIKDYNAAIEDILDMRDKLFDLF